MTRTLITLLLLAATTAPALAQTSVPPLALPSGVEEAVPLARLAPTSPTEPVIRIGDAPRVESLGTLFTAAPRGSLAQLDRDAVDAEIAARFGRRPAPARPRAQIVDGFVFEPDVSMLLKPNTASGLFRSTETPLQQR